MNIIITGAGKGIGFETALKLAADSNNTVIAISRNEAHLKKLSDKSKGAIKTLCYDFKQYKGIPTLLVPEIKKLVKQVDVLINNASVLHKKNLSELLTGEIEESFFVNVFAHMLLIKELLPVMGGKYPSHIVNVGSMGGVKGSVKFPGLSAYSATKAALINLTESIAAEVKDKNIFVNCLAFGSVQTEMFSMAFPATKAGLTMEQASKYLADFAMNGHKYFNGKVLEVSNSTP